MNSWVEKAAAAGQVYVVAIKKHARLSIKLSTSSHFTPETTVPGPVSVEENSSFTREENWEQA